MAKSPLKVVLDTNVLISALVFGGKPEQTYNLVLERQVIAVTSKTLIAELIENLIKRFNFEQRRIEQLDKIIKKHFIIVYPKEQINRVDDEDDNRVLEAAIEGNCSYVVTGDRDLLRLKTYKKIKIITPDEFLNLLGIN